MNNLNFFIMNILKCERFNILATLKVDFGVIIVDYARATNNGEVSEWPMVQSWKGCVGAIPPRVRIPSSPFFTFTKVKDGHLFEKKSIFIRVRFF